MFGIVKLNYTFSQKFRARFQGDIRYYGESELKDAASGLPFSGKRIRYAVGPGWNYQLNKHLSAHGLLKGFLMEQSRDIFVDNDITYRGLNVDIGFTYIL